MRNKLNNTGCLAQPFNFRSDFVGLQRAINDIERRVESRRDSFEGRRDKFIKSHADAFQSVKNFKLHLPQPIRDLITSQERLFDKIQKETPLNDEKDTLPELRKKYSEFWFSLSNAVSLQVYDRKNYFRKEWAALHEDNWMMPVFARGGRRKAKDIFPTESTSDSLKTNGGYMVAFIDY